MPSAFGIVAISFTELRTANTVANHLIAGLVIHWWIVLCHLIMSVAIFQ